MTGIGRYDLSPFFFDRFFSQIILATEDIDLSHSKNSVFFETSTAIRSDASFPT
ncbi:hypothetical protein SRABI27_01515 [Pedobacter sp. Bi27]|nr:hypothetical protein SRABI36_01176 [Pedobacter sp. Bi36]CAH0191449.1 hypothetical protein SRABI27_01515 [Pedobacter sp. Bi27]CAH0223294.1 hypothetical protein SRABI126_02268 [Pedobacter sp. Bi126]